MLLSSPLKFDEAEVRISSEKYIMSLESEYISWLNIFKNTPQDRLENATQNKNFSCSDLLTRYPNPKCLEVGCGPYPAGSLPPEEEHHISMRCCDVLAVPYGILHSLCGIQPYLKIDFSFVERLTDRYEENTFDIVRMSNALDHSYDPFSGVIEMLKVAKVGGTVRLVHFENEAEREFQYGMHQWNISSNGEDSMIIWRKNFSSDLRDVLCGAATVSTKIISQPYKWGTANVIHTDIVKLTDIETPAKRGMNVFDETFITFCLMKTSPRFSAGYQKAENRDPFRKSMFKKIIAYAPMSLRKYVPLWLERGVRKLAT